MFLFFICSIVFKIIFMSKVYEPIYNNDIHLVQQYLKW